MDKAKQFTIKSLNKKCISPLNNLEKEYKKMSIEEVEEKLDHIHSIYRNIQDGLFYKNIEPLDLESWFFKYRKLHNKISKMNRSKLRRVKRKIRK